MSHAWHPFVNPPTSLGEVCKTQPVLKYANNCTLHWSEADFPIFLTTLEAPLPRRHISYRKSSKELEHLNIFCMITLVYNYKDRLIKLNLLPVSHWLELQDILF